MTAAEREWLDRQIRLAGVASCATVDQAARAAWSARLVALAQVRAQVWKLAAP